MRVGLYDCDLDNEGKHGLSIDLLKLAGDYRNKNDIYSLIPTLTNLDLYTKIHYWSDLQPRYLTPDLVRNNIEPGGRSFGIKIPKEIEDVSYSTDIYRKWFEKNISKARIAKERAHQLLYGNHLRLERDGQTLNYSKHINPTNKLMMIYDENIFNVNNWKDILDDISEIKGSRIGFRYPVICDNLQNSLDIDKYTHSNFFSYRCYDLNCDKNTFFEFLKIYSENGAYSNFMISPPTFGTNHEKVQYIRKILSRIIFCQSKLSYFSLSYNDNIYFSDEFENFLKNLVEWRKCQIMNMRKNERFSFMNYLIRNYCTDWHAINYIFELEPEIKKLSVITPSRRISEEILYEPN